MSPTAKPRWSDIDVRVARDEIDLPPTRVPAWIGAAVAPRLIDAPTALDGLRLQPVTLVPEISLYLAEDPTVLWARLEADSGHRVAAPFWASAWTGGQALARYVLDNPDVVAGRRVLDVASGSGLVAIAAVRSGAASVVANDIDPYAAVLNDANARANGTEVDFEAADLLDGAGKDAEVILVGDGLYEPALAVRMLGFLERAAARGALVLVGDPGRGHVEFDLLEPIVTYGEAPHLGPAEDHQQRTPTVYRVKAPAISSIS
jgi:predicted nicotinamide N-methyase